MNCKEGLKVAYRGIEKYRFVERLRLAKLTLDRCVVLRRHERGGELALEVHGFRLLEAHSSANGPSKGR
jgi:hypothetical protein